MVENLLFIALGWALGGFINGLVGFGAAMVAIPLIYPFIDLSIAVPSCTIIVLVLNSHAGWVFRKSIEWRRLKNLLLGGVPGAVLGVTLLQNAPEAQLKAGMGIVITLYALWSLLIAPRSEEMEQGWRNTACGYIAGAFSTALGLAFGFNGPPLAMYSAITGVPQKAVKGLVAAGFIGTCLIILATQLVTGMQSVQSLQIALIAAPAAVIGGRMGIRLSARFGEASYRRVLLVGLGMMGISIIHSAVKMI